MLDQECQDFGMNKASVDLSGKMVGWIGSQWALEVAWAVARPLFLSTRKGSRKVPLLARLLAKLYATREALSRPWYGQSNFKTIWLSIGESRF